MSRRSLRSASAPAVPFEVWTDAVRPGVALARVGDVECEFAPLDPALAVAVAFDWAVREYRRVGGR